VYASFAKGKLGFRLSLFVFSGWICVLTGASLAWTVDNVGFYIRAYPLLAFGWVFALAFAFDYVLDKRGLSGRKFVLLVFCLIVASSGVTQAAFTVGTPKWSFMVSTDKSTYMQNETIQITVTVKNLGYIPHSFLSNTDPLILVGAWTADFYGSSPEQGVQVWYSVFVFKNQTSVTISPGQSFTRMFEWNQTNIYSSVPVGRGTYIVEAYVADLYGEPEPFPSPFWNQTLINITSTG